MGTANALSSSDDLLTVMVVLLQDRIGNEHMKFLPWNRSSNRSLHVSRFDFNWCDQLFFQSCYDGGIRKPGEPAGGYQGRSISSEPVLVHVVPYRMGGGGN